jgi:predicted YcjX-like family ATPase
MSEISMDDIVDKLVKYFSKFGYRKNEAIEVFMHNLAKKANVMEIPILDIMNEATRDNAKEIADRITDYLEQIKADKHTGICAVMTIVMTVLERDPEDKMPMLADIILNFNPQIDTEQAVAIATSIMNYKTTLH